MTIMKKLIIALSLVFVAITSCGGNTTPQEKTGQQQSQATVSQRADFSASNDLSAGYTLSVTHKGDSAHIERLLHEGAAQPDGTNLPLFFARHFKGYPYVAFTLDQNKEEQLVINTEGLDCTTFVENVLALTICVKRQLNTFHDFCDVLTQVRYIKGKVAYTSRQHYFTIWIADNLADSLIEEIQLPKPPMSATRKANVNYMTTHVESYKMLSAHPQWVPAIREMEKQVNNISFTYVPKAQLRDSNKYRDYIHDGDIIGIVTNKKGLDISHVGFAVWHADGLHLFNASSLHKKVVDEPMTLYQYLLKQTSSVGIRVVRIK